MSYQKVTALTARHLSQLHELYQQEWWTKGRSRAETEVMAQNSDLLFCAVDSTKDELVGFARVLTDGIFKALLFDVIVVADHRKEGIGKLLMNWILEHPELRQAKHLELYCLSAMFPFYEQWGFTADLGEVKLMRLTRPTRRVDDDPGSARGALDGTIEYSTEKLLIRRYVEADLEDRLKALVESADEISAWLMLVHAGYAEADNLAWFSKCENGWQTGSAYHFAVIETDSNIFVGECFLNNINTRHKFANLAYWIRTGETGKGYASTAVKLIARFGFEQLRLQRLEIFMSPDNAASRRVAEKAGAKKEGLLRNRIFHVKADNALMYSLIREDLK